VPSNTSLERTRSPSSAKPKRRRARRSAQPLERTNLFCCSELIARSFPPGSAAPKRRGCALKRPARSAGRKRRSTEPPRSIESPVEAVAQLLQSVKASVLAPLGLQRHPRSQLRRAPFDPRCGTRAIRLRSLWQGTQSASSRNDMCALTPRSSGRDHDQVPSSCASARAAQLSR